MHFFAHPLADILYMFCHVILREEFFLLANLDGMYLDYIYLLLHSFYLTFKKFSLTDFFVSLYVFTTTKLLNLKSKNFIFKKKIGKKNNLAGRRGYWAVYYTSPQSFTITISYMLA